MMFIAPHVRLTIVTRHVPLKDVPKLITSKAVFNSIALMAKILKSALGSKIPRLPYLALILMQEKMGF